MEKIYPSAIYSTDDKELFALITAIPKGKELSDDMKLRQREAADLARNMLGINKVVGLGHNEETQTSQIIVYNVESTDAYFEQRVDENDKVYIQLIRIS